MLGHDGRELLMLALLGYSYGNLDAMREMLLHPNAALGLSDGGAHCGAICDASIPTFMLTHWARDRAGASGCPSSSSSEADHATPPGSTASATAAWSHRATRPTST